jgi:hypothetical protein
MDDLLLIFARVEEFSKQKVQQASQEARERKKTRRKAYYMSRKLNKNTKINDDSSFL